MGFWKAFGRVALGIAGVAVGGMMGGLLGRFNECLMNRTGEDDGCYAENKAKEHSCGRYFSKKARRVEESDYAARRKAALEALDQ